MWTLERKKDEFNPLVLRLCPIINYFIILLQKNDKCNIGSTPFFSDFAQLSIILSTFLPNCCKKIDTCNTGSTYKACMILRFPPFYIDIENE